MVVVHAGQGAKQAVIEAGNLTAFGIGQIFEVEAHYENGLMAEDVGAGDGANVFDSHGGKVSFVDLTYSCSASLYNRKARREPPDEKQQNVRCCSEASVHGIY
jgi:hypothetical protein